MPHALIIDDNRAVSRGIEQRLQAFGFNSFDHTWSERQALEASARHRPDLIVIGDEIAGGSPVDVARQVALRSDAPVLAVTRDKLAFAQFAPADATLEGPYHLNQMAKALAAAGVEA